MGQPCQTGGGIRYYPILDPYSDPDGKAVLPIGFGFRYCSTLALAFCIVSSVRAWLAGALTPAALVILIMLALFVGKVNMTEFIALTSYRNLTLSKNKIQGIFQEGEEPAESPSFAPKGTEIRFENVGFSYVEGEPVLKKAGFTIPEGKLTAIVGDSGAGKSTVLNLIAKYYQPQAGRVTIGGQDIRDMPTEQVLERISLVDQDVFLFNDTVRNNIRYARPGATDQEVEAACRLANCDGFIRAMEQGYETEIGENGNRHFENFNFPLDKSKNLVYIQNVISKQCFEFCKGGFPVAKQIEGVYDAVLACAKEEFLNKGYQEASLRTIAQKAGTSTGSIYTRFGDKEGVFEAIVQPVVSGFMALVCEIQETFHGFDSETQKQRVNEYSFSEMQRGLDYMYAHFDEFRLLLDASHGTRFQNFVDELAQVEVEYTYKFLETVGWSDVKELPSAKELMHIVTTGYFEGVFEVIRHRMDRETAGKYVERLERYHAAGFYALFSPEK